MNLLVTTAIEETWGENQPIVFLGEWCRRYHRKNVWDSRVYTTVHYHWDDREKLARDYDDLKKLHESLLEALAVALNNYHKIDRPLRYWRMILDPWLVSYVAVIFDRWECLRLAFEKHEYFEMIEVELIPGCKPCFDSNDFVEKITDDPWNHQLFLEIVKTNYINQCSIKKLSVKSHSMVTSEMAPLSMSKGEGVKRKIVKFVDSLLRRLPIRNRVVFFQSYFPPLALVKLNLHLKQLPRLYLKEFEWPVSFCDLAGSSNYSQIRADISLDIKPKNSFETFLFNRVLNDLPEVYLERFSSLQSKSRKICMNPDVIFSAVAHWGNELFKLWSAEQVFKGSKFVAIQHGGSINIGSLIALDFEENISDHYASWSLPTHPKHVQLPPSKLVNFPKHSKKKHLLFVALDHPRYAFRAQSSPISGQILMQYAQSIELYKSLNSELQDCFRVKPYEHPGWWDTTQRYIEVVGEEKVVREKTLLDLYAEARVIVCSYPNTTPSEALASGLPFILLFPENLWEFNPKMLPIIELLKSAKIIFNDPIQAAAHLATIWAVPDVWWNSSDVVKARSEFHRQVCKKIEQGWLGQWATFIKNVSSSANNPPCLRK